MSTSEASQQANRAEMDPRRLLVVVGLIVGFILTLFFGRVVSMLMARFGVNDAELLAGGGIQTSNIVGLLMTGGLATWVMMNSKAKTFAFETATELMRVTWPSFDEVKNSTAAVIIASLVAAVILFAMDTLSYKLMVEWLPKWWGFL